MRIIVHGAGSIGSLFGAFLARYNEVVLTRRSYDKNRNGIPVELRVTGLDDFSVKLPIYTSLCAIPFTPDLVLLTVKSYDTEKAVSMIKDCIGDDTIVLSLQNGLGNLECIARIIEPDLILGGITTYGAYLSEPLVVEYTGSGDTIIGGYKGYSKRVYDIVKVFREAGINTRVTRCLKRELWVKAIINSSINPLSAVFRCRNGYLYENPILRRIVETVCKESTHVASRYGVKVSYPDMLKRTFKVINDTSLNFSSMLQSLDHGKRTEIDSINGVIVDIGKKLGCDVTLNSILLSLVKDLEKGYIGDRKG